MNQQGQSNISQLNILKPRVPRTLSILTNSSKKDVRKHPAPARRANNGKETQQRQRNLASSSPLLNFGQTHLLR